MSELKCGFEMTRFLEWSDTYYRIPDNKTCQNWADENNGALNA